MIPVEAGITSMHNGIRNSNYQWYLNYFNFLFIKYIFNFIKFWKDLDKNVQALMKKKVVQLN